VLQPVGVLRLRPVVLRHGVPQSGNYDVLASNDVSVASIVTLAFFDMQAGDGCEVKGFCTCDAFLAAAGCCTVFGRTGRHRGR
jgi:hypothetical protein